jgi:hypothetical protein
MALAAWLCLPFAACADSTVSSACRELCECEGCDEASQSACIDEGEAASASSETAGCEEAFDDYISCVRDGLSCDGGVAGATSCASDGQALTTCGGVAPPLGNPCREVGKICNGKVETGNLPKCDGLLRCRSECLLEAGLCDEETSAACAEQCP